MIAFYRQAKMADGFLGKCKDCTKKDVVANYQANRPAKQAYERKRQQQPERRAKKREYSKSAYRRPEVRERLAAYRSRPEVRAKSLEYHQKSREKFPEKYEARMLVGIALRAGRLSKEPCSACGSSLDLHAHHEDYSKPLEVTWLCAACHREEHPRSV